MQWTCELALGVGVQALYVNVISLLFLSGWCRRRFVSVVSDGKRSQIRDKIGAGEDKFLLAKWHGCLTLGGKELYFQGGWLL